MSEMNDLKKKPRAPKTKVLLICVLAAAIVVGAGFGLNSMTGQNVIEEPGVPLGADATFTNVQFASYKQAEGIPVILKASSVERDLAIVILDEDLMPVTGVGFEVVVTDPEGRTATFTDEEGSGKIYLEDLEPGDYTVTLEKTGRFLPPEPIQIEVKTKVEASVIENIGDKIVNAKNVDATKEDAGYGGKNIGQTPPPPQTDTVVYVESRTEEKSVPRETTVTKYEAVVDGNGNLIPKAQPASSGVTPASSTLLSYYFIAYEQDQDPDPNPDPDPEPPETFTPDLDDGYLVGATGSKGTKLPLGEVLDKFENKPVVLTETVYDIVTTYYGWQTIEGRRYYYDSTGNFVTGSQVIQGAAYVFDSNGVLQQQLRGVDVSTWQAAINWGQVKNAGIHFAMIRAGYRGYGSGVLVEDDKFRIHAQGAQAAGLKVGLYYFSQAINEREAVEEASAAIAIARKHGISVGYPIAIDIEYSNGARNGRADNISGATRTAVAVAFCNTIASAGYTPMIYASKSWFENPGYLNIGQLGPYKIWLAHWTEQTNYKGKIDMWQYTSSGSVPGISGRVDMNISYLGY